MTMTDASIALAEGLRAIEAGEVGFDLAAVDAVDSSAVAILIAWRRLAQARGVRLAFMNTPDALCTLAHLYGLSDLLLMHEHGTAHASH